MFYIFLLFLLAFVHYGYYDDPFFSFFFLMIRRPPNSPLFPYTPLFRSVLFEVNKEETLVPAVIQFRDPNRSAERETVIGAAHTVANMLPAGGIRAEASVLNAAVGERSEEHTSELQSPHHLVSRLLLQKK